MIRGNSAMHGVIWAMPAWGNLGQYVHGIIIYGSEEDYSNTTKQVKASCS